jgi:mannosyl-oligosaccharide alpha-1,2-mannosidase
LADPPRLFSLKYYYLLFADPQFLSLDEYVFNTEGHPLRLPLPTGQVAPSSFTPTWRLSKLDRELTERYSDPLEQDREVVGRGTFVQQLLIKVMV